MISELVARRLGFVALYLLLALSMLLGATAGAETWRGKLLGGGEIQVDPDTHRAMRYSNGAPRTMWDGSHRLEDGSFVIVRDGAVVPNAQMLETWQGEPAPVPDLRGRWCEQLVVKTCGHYGECGAESACSRSRDLRDSEAKASATGVAGGDGAEDAEQACRAALDDAAAFPACAASESLVPDSACDRLVEQACGGDEACASSAACNAARQLVDLERSERLEHSNPRGSTTTAAQCRTAIDNAFFKPCGK